MKNQGGSPMKHLARLTAVLALASLALTSPARASINLNSSRSNIYRVTHSTTLMTSAQASAILADLEKTPGMDEAAIKRALPQLLKKNGIDPKKVKETVVRRDKDGKNFSIILLDKPEDLPAALAFHDGDAPPPDKPKTKPKN
jgi:hypothetical protein